MLKRAALVMIGLMLGLILVLLLALASNAWRQSSRQPRVAPQAVDLDVAAHHLANSLRFRTIARVELPDHNADPFMQLRAYLAQTSALVDANQLPSLILAA